MGVDAWPRLPPCRLCHAQLHGGESVPSHANCRTCEVFVAAAKWLAMGVAKTAAPRPHAVSVAMTKSWMRRTILMEFFPFSHHISHSANRHGILRARALSAGRPHWSSVWWLLGAVRRSSLPESGGPRVFLCVVAWTCAAWRLRARNEHRLQLSLFLLMEAHRDIGRA